MSDEMPESQCKLKLEDVAIDLMRRLGNGEMLECHGGYPYKEDWLVAIKYEDNKLYGFFQCDLDRSCCYPEDVTFCVIKRFEAVEVVYDSKRFFSQLRSSEESGEKTGEIDKSGIEGDGGIEPELISGQLRDGTIYRFARKITDRLKAFFKFFPT